MRKILWAIAAVTAAACAKQPGDAPRTYSGAAVPAELAPAVRAADESIELLKGRLVARLTEEMQRGGPTAAIDVCRSEAQAVTHAVATERGVDLGRTSHRLRNPSNAPRDWARPHLAGVEGQKAEAVAPRVVDLGDRVGVLRPLATMEMCLACHGPREGLAPEVRAVLERTYPGDEAVGFAAGDFRGYAWAEVAKNTR
jgi:hypothetical protein